MRQSARRMLVEESITGAIGLAMVTLFLGFMAVDIGDIALAIVTLIVLVMVSTDFIQTVKELRRRDSDQEAARSNERNALK